MCFVYHSCNCLRNILNIPLHFGRVKRYIADVSIIFERPQNSVIHKILRLRRDCLSNLNKNLEILNQTRLYFSI